MNGELSAGVCDGFASKRYVAVRSGELCSKQSTNSPMTAEGLSVGIVSGAPRDRGPIRPADGDYILRRLISNEGPSQRKGVDAHRSRRRASQPRLHPSLPSAGRARSAGASPNAAACDGIAVRR